MVKKNSTTFDSSNIITYQAVEKMLTQILREEYIQLKRSAYADTQWTIDGFIQGAVRKILAENLLRPKTDYMFLTEVSEMSKAVALNLMTQAPTESDVSETDLVLEIAAHLKTIQEEKKAAREVTQRGKVRSLSAEQLAKYASVQLSDKSAKAFMKEVDSREKRKK